VRHQLQERRQREGSVLVDLEEVSVWPQVPEDTFYKRRHRGSDTVAALREREAAPRGRRLGAWRKRA